MINWLYQWYHAEGEIKQALNGHLCRCASHNRIVRAVQKAAKEMA